MKKKKEQKFSFRIPLPKKAEKIMPSGKQYNRNKIKRDSNKSFFYYLMLI